MIVILILYEFSVFYERIRYIQFLRSLTISFLSPGGRRRALIYLRRVQQDFVSKSTLVVSSHIARGVVAFVVLSLVEYLRRESRVLR
jgi:hypothetical protein